MIGQVEGGWSRPPNPQGTGGGQTPSGDITLHDQYLIAPIKGSPWRLWWGTTVCGSCVCIVHHVTLWTRSIASVLFMWHHPGSCPSSDPRSSLGKQQDGFILISSAATFIILLLLLRLISFLLPHASVFPPFIWKFLQFIFLPSTFLSFVWLGFVFSASPPLLSLTVPSLRALLSFFSLTSLPPLPSQLSCFLCSLALALVPFAVSPRTFQFVFVISEFPKGQQKLGPVRSNL